MKAIKPLLCLRLSRLMLSLRGVFRSLLPVVGTGETPVDRMLAEVAGEGERGLVTFPAEAMDDFSCEAPEHVNEVLGFMNAAIQIREGVLFQGLVGRRRTPTAARRLRAPPPWHVAAIGAQYASAPRTAWHGALVLSLVARAAVLAARTHGCGARCCRCPTPPPPRSRTARTSAAASLRLRCREVLPCVPAATRTDAEK